MVQQPSTKASSHDATQSLRVLQDLLATVQTLDQTAQTDRALDVLYEFVDNLLLDSQFADTNRLLQLVDVKNTSLDILLGLLTTTLPARDKIPFRTALFADVASAIAQHGEDQHGLLAGLE